jgi:protein-S-isoprenylcysteine O-methyltransferase Ste14
MLAFEMAVPIYWLILHVLVVFWRRHVRAAFAVAVVIAWGVADILLYRFRLELFGYNRLSGLSLLGMFFIGFDVFAFSKSEVALGGHRILGRSELSGSRELIARGPYARVRHPRYLGMIAGVFGACMVVASPSLWALSIVWLVLVLLMIRAEERELHARLGPAYAAYARHVPALLPCRPRPRKPQASTDQEQRL